MLGKIKLKIIKFCTSYPKSVIAISLLSSIIFISGIPKIVQDDDMVRLLPDDLPSIKTFSDITDEFGNYEFMYIAMGNKNRDVFESDFLKIVWDISKDFEQLQNTLGSTVDEVISISTTQKISAKIESVYDPFEGTIIDTTMNPQDLITKAILDKNEIQEIKNYLDNNLNIKSQLISKNNDYVNIMIRPKDNHDYAFLSNMIHEISSKYKFDNNGEKIEYHFGGQSYISGAVPGIVAKEVKVLALYGLMIMTLILLINLKNIQSVILILTIISLSLLSMLGFMGWVYYLTLSPDFYFTLNNTSMPIILLTIANSDGVHIISRFFKELRIFKHTKQAVVSTMDNLFKPISLTSITTMAAFLTLIFSPLEGMNGYGITLAFGIGWAWILSLTLMPALISTLNWDPNSKAVTKPSYIELAMTKFGRIATNHPKKILIIGLSAVLISITGLFNLKVEVNMSEMFRPGSVIKDSADFLDENMTGNLNVLIKVSGSDTTNFNMKKPENLKSIEKLQNYLDDMDAVSTTMSIVDVVKQLHKVIEGDNPKFETIPNDRDKINTLFTLYQNSGGEDISSLINNENNEAVLTALMKTFSTSDMAVFKEDILNFIRTDIKTNNEDIKFDISGVMAFLSDFIWLVIKTAATSIILSIVIICLIASIFYKSFKFGLLSIIPLLTAIIINFGLMGLFGIDVTHMTAILSSIIIGVGVDFSIHYTSEFKRMIEENKSNKTKKTIDNVGHPILLDALSNMGFASLMLSTIIPMTQIGGLMVFAMCACSLGTLTLLASSIEIFKHKLS